MSKDLSGLWHLPDNVGRLPFTVQPRELEPAESIIYRLALANGYSTVRRMLHSTPNFPQILYSYAMTRERSIALAVRLGDLPRASLEAATPHRTRRRTTVLGHNFLKFRRIHDARICPMCIADDMKSFDGPERLRPFRRNWWEIHSIGACVIHAVPLVGSCPKCRKGLSLTGSSVKCDCDPRAELWSAASQVVPDEDMVHDRWLLGRLGVVDKVEHSFLDTLRPDMGSQLCLIIGNIIEHQFSLSTTDQPRPSFSVGARSRGWRALQNWPRSFEQFLDRLYDRHEMTDQNDQQHLGVYGGLNLQLTKQGALELKAVFTAMRDHKRGRLAAAKAQVRNAPSLGEHVA